MSLFVVGLNHRTAPLDLREKLTVDKDQLAPALNRLSGSVEQNIIISTCNRLEVYSYGTDQDRDYHRVVDFLRSKCDLTEENLKKHLYCLQGKECAEHLFRVSAGLDSMIIGERQVLGQVRNAFSVSTAEGYSKGPLSRLFHQALRVGRRQRNLGRFIYKPNISHRSRRRRATRGESSLRCRSKESYCY